MFHHSPHRLTCKNGEKIAQDEYRRKLKIILATPSSKKHPEGTVSWKLRLNSGKKKEITQEGNSSLP